MLDRLSSCPPRGYLRLFLKLPVLTTLLIGFFLMFALPPKASASSYTYSHTTLYTPDLVLQPTIAVTITYTVSGADINAPSDRTRNGAKERRHQGEMLPGTAVFDLKGLIRVTPVKLSETGYQPLDELAGAY